MAHGDPQRVPASLAHKGESVNLQKSFLKIRSLVRAEDKSRPGEHPELEQRSQPLDAAIPIARPSMERSVKTNLSRSPPVLFNVGVRSQSARAAWLVRVQIARAFGTCTLIATRPQLALEPSASADDGRSSPSFRRWHPRRDRSTCVLAQKREPSFYLGLFRPLLLSVLRGGIAYPWDLREHCSGARDCMDTLPRTNARLQVLRQRSSRSLGDRRLRT